MARLPTQEARASENLWQVAASPCFRRRRGQGSSNTVGEASSELYQVRAHGGDPIDANGGGDNNHS